MYSNYENVGINAFHPSAIGQARRATKEEESFLLGKQAAAPASSLTASAFADLANVQNDLRHVLDELYARLGVVLGHDYPVQSDPKGTNPERPAPASQLIGEIHDAHQRTLGSLNVVNAILSRLTV